MKGLLLKEWYSINRNCRILLILTALFIGCFFIGGNGYFFLVYSIFLMGMTSFITLSYDEFDGWQKFSLVMPNSRKMIVSSKFVVSLISELAVALISMVALLIKREKNVLLIMLIVFSIGLFLTGFSLLLAFKFGTRKGKIMMIVLVLLMNVGASSLFVFDEIGQSGIQQNEFTQLSPYSFIIFIAASAFYALTWYLSAKVFEKRDL